MSDFDTVLERLMVDPAFRAALGADPGRALAGYRLSSDEMELLHGQVETGASGHRQVEQRTSKASLFGLLSPLAGAVGLGGEDVGTGGIGGSIGFGGAGQGSGFGPAGYGIGDAMGEAGTGGFSAATGAGFGPAESAGLASAGFGPGDSSGPAGWAGAADAGMSEADMEELAGQVGRPMDYGGGGGGGLVGHHLGGVQPTGQAGLGAAAPPPDYHPRIDVNGDGRWDQYTVQRRGDGGVDLFADMNRDGRADFVGHDVDRDGLVDSADYDKDHDGRFETHMRDVNGDGWLDTRSVDPPPRQQDGVSGVGRHRAPDEDGFGAAHR